MHTPQLTPQEEARHEFRMEVLAVMSKFVLYLAVVALAYVVLHQATTFIASDLQIQSIEKQMMQRMLHESEHVKIRIENEFKLKQSEQLLDQLRERSQPRLQFMPTVPHESKPQRPTATC